mmetsp:Transcript_4473/g.7727  ORF Transcript_4473/g.7727 Transcript_4473/m.7727 type:complete len:277 (+) Transcript_4473:58-888(+)
MEVVGVSDKEPLSFAGSTLVFPGCGGVAHVGEMCVDALVSSFALKRVAYVKSRYLLPVVMSNAWSSGPPEAKALSLTTAAELYKADSAPGLVVLQIRTPLAAGCRRRVAQELWDWVQSAGFASVVIAAPCSSHVKVDADIDAATELRYLHVHPEGLRPCDLSEVLPLGHALPEPGSDPASWVLAQKQLRGSGLARSFLEIANGSSSGIGVLCLLAFSGESLNGFVLEKLTSCVLEKIARLVGIACPALKPPPSWLYEGLMPLLPDLPSLEARHLWG